MSHSTENPDTRTVERDHPWPSGMPSKDPPHQADSQWVRVRLSHLNELLERLDEGDQGPQQRVRALATLRRPILGMVKTLSRLDAKGPGSKVSALAPYPTPAQRLIERMCRNLGHLLVALDHRRFLAEPGEGEDRRWTIRQLFAFLGLQIEWAILQAQPCPPHTWQRLHDLFEYLIERGGLELGTGSSDIGKGFDPETAYKRLLLLSLCPSLEGLRRLDGPVANQIMRWAIESHLAEPAGHLGEYGLIAVETSQDGPPRFREQSVNDPWRGWVLEPPAEFLAFARFRRPSLSLADPRNKGRALLGGSR
jgi:hypothetical protein